MKNLKENLTRRNIIGFFVIVVTLFVLVGFTYGIVNYNSIRGEVFQLINDYGFYSLFGITAFLELFPQMLSPHVAILIASSFELNPYLVFLYVVLGSIFGSGLGFFLGRKYGYEFVKDFVADKTLKKIEFGINHKGRWFVFVTTFTPIPYLPLAFGAVDMTWKNFIIFGMIPRALTYLIVVIFAYTIYPAVLNFFSTFF